jgi:hypothetical protein
MAATPVGTFARRLGIRAGRVAIPAGLLVILAGALLFLLPPHNTIAAIGAGMAGVAGFGFGIVSFSRGPRWLPLAGVVAGGLLFAALTVAGRGLALHMFGSAETCQVVHRQEVDTSSRYPHHGFVHTLSCPVAGTLTIRTDATDRQEQGARVTVLDDPSGLLEPDFASRHILVVDVLVLGAAVALVAGTVRMCRVRSAS